MFLLNVIKCYFVIFAEKKKKEVLSKIKHLVSLRRMVEIVTKIIVWDLHLIFTTHVLTLTMNRFPH